MSGNAVLLLRANDIDLCVGPEDALEATRRALIASAKGEVEAPVPFAFDFGDPPGEAHVKGARLHGAASWTVKLAAGFYRNPEVGLATASGMSLVSSSETGLPQALILDGGRLTDMRTAAAGALAADALAPQEVRRVGVIGCGIQARIQLEYLLRVRQPEEIVVWGRSAEKAERFAAETSGRLGLTTSVGPEPSAVARGSQVVITVTPSREPLLRGDGLDGPVAIVAVGSDMPGKRELDDKVLEAASLITADDPARAAEAGELQHARHLVDSAVPLGALLDSERGAPSLAVVDLTGLGAEDASIADLAVQRARERGVGEIIDLG